MSKEKEIEDVELTINSMIKKLELEKPNDYEHTIHLLRGILFTFKNRVKDIELGICAIEELKQKNEKYELALKMCAEDKVKAEEQIFADVFMFKECKILCPKKEQYYLDKVEEKLKEVKDGNKY